MDILTHALSGTAVAVCSSSFVKTTIKKRAGILFVGTLGGVFPDLDAISMWSRFDFTIGQLFNLSHTGREIYGMKLWYSHHAFFHSLSASILFGFILVAFIYLFRKKKNEAKNFHSFRQRYSIYFITFVLSYWAHLAGDLPTPSSVWGGIAFLWPAEEYIGGYGKIWWWNNYDIFLLILSYITITLVLPMLSKYIRSLRITFSILFFCITLNLILIQINNRQFNYAYIGNTSKYTEMELNSKKEQEQILGKRIYRYMSWLDQKLKFHF